MIIYYKYKDFCAEYTAIDIMAETIYLKALTVRDPSDIDLIKKDIKMGMILIIRVGPMAQKDLDGLRQFVDELYSIARQESSDIARLGEERILVTPSGVQIWKPQYDLK